jgi:hypothetical protein
MARYIENLTEVTVPQSGDYLLIYDADAPSHDKDRRLNIANIDHGILAGLADDDHSQYLALAGRASGQIAYGGTAASETLKLG